jgi:hypothetical protein
VVSQNTQPVVAGTSTARGGAIAGFSAVHEPTRQAVFWQCQRCSPTRGSPLSRPGACVTPRARRPKHRRSTSSTTGRSFTRAGPGRTRRSPVAELDVHHDRPASDIIDGQHPHRPESDEQRAHARRVRLHRAASELDCLGQPSCSRSPVLRVADPHTPLGSEAPSYLMSMRTAIVLDGS